jgi:hypothetical protein
LANDKAINYWFLSRTGLQFWQRTAVWHNSFTTNINLLPDIQTTILAHSLQLEAVPNTLKLSIEPFFYAKFNFIYEFRIKSALRRIEESFEGVRQLFRPVSILEATIDELEHSSPLSSLMSRAAGIFSLDF